MWYDINKALSYNCLFNFIIGPRGVGKTYSTKKRVLKNWFKKKKQFVYLRRYDTELQSTQMSKFFDDIGKEFEENELVAKDSYFYCDKKVIGYYIPLSKSAQYKSVPFPDVSMIIFDEFIIDQGMIRYLPKEVETLLEMYSTISRNRDVPIVFLSNAITFTNPYFLFFDIKFQEGQRVFKRKDLYVELVDSPAFTEMMEQTRFGQLVANTNYGKYAIQNKFLRDNTTFVEKIPESSFCVFNIAVNGELYGVHRIRGSNIFYVTDKPDITLNNTISLDLDDHNESTVLKQSSTSRYWYEAFKEAYMRGEARFTSIKIKNIIISYLKKN